MRNRGASTGVVRSRNPNNLRQESAGKRRIKDQQGSNNAESSMKLEHLQRLAVWASEEASIPSLSAFFRYRSPDSSLFPCNRCGTILQSAFNCARLDRNKQFDKTKDQGQGFSSEQCGLHMSTNAKRGTPRAHAKALCPEKDREPSESKPSFTQKSQSKDIRLKGEEKNGKESDLTSNLIMEGVLTTDTVTPFVKIGRTLLDGKRKRNRSIPKKQNDPKSISTQTDRVDVDSSVVKRRRKSWTSLKEIARAENKKQTL